MSGQVCECGHTPEEHAPPAKVRVTRRPCLVAGCECEHFRAARPNGLCECGCGEKTRLAPKNDPAKGWVKGEPLRFVYQHSPRRGTPPPVRRGRDNPSYNGGLHVREEDNRCVIFCRDGSLLYYYRGLMAAQIGRLLRRDEIVHHKNGDPSDDRIENLEVMSRAEHTRLHRDDIRAGRWGVRAA